MDIEILPPPLIGTIEFESNTYSVNELIEVCSATPFQIEISPFVESGTPSQVNGLPIYRVKSWSKSSTKWHLKSSKPTSRASNC